MVGTVTTVGWCAVKNGLAFTGSHQDILKQLCEISLVGENRIVTVKFPGFLAVELHGYSESYSDEEAMKDARATVFKRLDE